MGEAFLCCTAAGAGLFTGLCCLTTGATVAVALGFAGGFRLAGGGCCFPFPGDSSDSEE